MLVLVFQNFLDISKSPCSLLGTELHGPVLKPGAALLDRLLRLLRAISFIRSCVKYWENVVSSH